MKKIVIEGGTGEITEKRSRFIANVFPITSEEEAIQLIAQVKKKNPDSRHNCSAYVVGEISKFSDDGEPSGTAGKPILDVINGRELTNVLVVVTRYFGGILLGTGGLVRAYQGATKEGLDQTTVAEKYHGYRFEIHTDYTGLGKLQYLTANEGIEVIDTRYADDVRMILVCEDVKFAGFQKKVTEATSGKTLIEEKEEVEYYKTEKGVWLI